MLSRDEYLKLHLEQRFIPLDEAKAARANRLFDSLPTVDLHTHIFGSLHFSFDYDQIRQIGVTGLFEAVPAVSEDFDESVRLLGKYKSLVAHQPGLISATRAEDIRRAKREGKQAVLYQLEPQTMGRDPNRIDIAYGLGFRMMLLTFNTKNYLGDGCSERTDCGLSYLGIEVVRRLNELGILIDLSHCGIQTSLDTCKHSKAPVLFNHTGARAESAVQATQDGRADSRGRGHRRTGRHLRDSEPTLAQSRAGRRGHDESHRVRSETRRH